MNKRTKALQDKNNELLKKVNKENDEVLTDIVCYLRAANISLYQQEAVRQDLLDMVLSAQERGETIQDMVGYAYKAFCDDIIANLPHRSRKERILEVIDTILLCTCVWWSLLFIILFTLDSVTNLGKGKPVNLMLPVTLGSLILYGLSIVAANIIVQLTLKSSFQPKKEKSPSKLKQFFIYFLIGAGVMSVCLLFAWIGKPVIFTINLFLAWAVILFLYITHKFLPKNE